MPRVVLISFVLCLGGPSVRAQQPDAQRLGVQTLSFLAVSVPDLEASTRWYQKTFALTDVRNLPGSDGSVSSRLLSSRELVVELSQHAKARALRDYAGAPTPTFLVHGFFKAGFFVGDLDRAVELLRARGVTTLSEVRADRDTNTRWVLFRDNAGNFLQVLERKP